jgi:small ligand-binding sensory domain FIST
VTQIQFAAASSSEPNLDAALNEVTVAVKEGLADASPDFAVLFVSAPHIFRRQAELSEIVRGLLSRLGTENLIGCSASGVIGGQREFEQRAAVSLFAAALPAARVSTFYCNEIERRKWNSGGSLSADMKLIDGRQSPLFLLSDPFTFNIEDFLKEVESIYPKLRILGGLASGSGAPGLNLLFHGAELKNNGCVGLQVSGDFAFHTIVSQGCKAIGRHGVITSGKGNLIRSIRGRSPREELQELILQASKADRKLIQRSLLMGIVIDEQRHEFHRGDFLVRPILQVSGDGMLIGDTIKIGQTVQFHVRDSETATADLDELLQKVVLQSSFTEAKGALLFTCNGRGQQLFGVADHDTSKLREKLGDVPVGGFFCAGEIGPVGDKHFLHGFTSSIGIFTSLPSP